jgi:hypothetical protein
MASKTFPVIQAMNVRFDEIARMSDQEIYAYFVFMCRSSRKKIFKKTPIFNHYLVSRGANELRIDLINGDRITGRFSFIPPPDFSQRMVQI